MRLMTLRLLHKTWFKSLRVVFFSFLVLTPLFLSGADDTNDTGVVLLTVDGPIGPATSDYVVGGIEFAEIKGAKLVVIQMDTPGGLDTAMRDINQKILASSVPVATYVAPSGARAASAGTYILYASHVAAMAPATSLGAATPVPIGGAPGMPDQQPQQPGSRPVPQTPDGENGGTKREGKKPGAGDQGAPQGKTAMERKILNDSVAYIKGLAKLRGRNVEWAEEAVRKASSLTADEAVEQNVADLVVSDLGELLDKIHGKEVKVMGQNQTLATKGLTVTRLDPDWRNKLLSIITDPNIIPILMMLGVFGLLYELLNPGFVLPGVIGGICLLLGLYAVQVLPVNYAGLALMLLGLIFMVSEAFVPSFGALGIGGVIAFVAGSIMLMDTDVEGYAVSWPLITFVAVLGAVLIIGVLTLLMKSRERKVESGKEEMIGAVGEAMDDFQGKGTIKIHSEIWSAYSKQPVTRGQKVKVVALNGLILDVEPKETEDA